MVWQVVGAVASIAGVGLGLTGARDAKKAGRAEERAERRATQEDLRRRRVFQGDLIGKQTVAAAAMGKDVRSQSVLEMKREAMQEFFREQEITRQVGVSRAAAIRSRTRSAQYAGYGAALQGVGQFAAIAQSVEDSGGGWWS